MTLNNCFKATRAVAVDEWNAVFQQQVTETYSSSLRFMKELTVATVSIICSSYNIFPEEDFTTAKFGGLELKILKPKCNDELAQLLVDSLGNAFDSLDKKYLHKIALCFYATAERQRRSAESLLGCHVLVYEYGDGPGAGGAGGVRVGQAEGHTTTITMQNVREKTVQLMRTCRVMLSECPFPKEFDLVLRTYYNNSVPEGYQAPGFMNAAETWDPLEADVAAWPKLGSVSTPFHRLHLYTMFSETTAAHAAVAENTAVISQESDELINKPVMCECGRTDRLSNSQMLTCTYCGSLQHGVCYGTLEAGGARAHCCVPCAEVDPGRATDHRFAAFTNRKCLAIFRRALSWLERQERVSACSVATALTLNDSSAHKLVRVLRAHKLLATDPPAHPDEEMEVVSSEIKGAMSRFFNTPAPVLTDRLLQDSQCSQRSDVLSEVLSPVENESLASSRTSAVAARVRTEGQRQAPGEGETLEKYRRALGAPTPPADAPAPTLPMRRLRCQTPASDDNSAAPNKRTRKSRK